MMHARSTPFLRCGAGLAVATLALGFAGFVPSPSVPEGTPRRLAPGLVVDRARGEVRVLGRVAAVAGFLEQLACLEGTREHEALVSTPTRPSGIHAGLLLLGLVPGEPGSWTVDPDGSLVVREPHGPEIGVFVRFPRGGRVREVPLVEWVEGLEGERWAAPLVFAGSLVRPNPPSLARILGPGEHYVADLTGSLVGLATFGDETVAPVPVLPDRAEVAAPRWRARTAAMPASGTPVTLVFRLARPGREALP